MAKAFVFIYVLIFTFSAYGQFFEGKIIYKNSFKSKMPNLTDEKLTSMLGNIQEYYIKGGNYKSISNGSLSGWQLYINSDNKLYNKTAGSDKITWLNGALYDDEVLSADSKKDVIEILGYKCDELILICKSGVQKYYFNSKLSIDVQLYKNHKYGNWYDYLSRSKSLPLKIIIDMPQFTMESIATEVDPLKLETLFFELPANSQIEKGKQ